MKQKIVEFLDVAVEYALYGLIFFVPVSIAGISIFAGLAIVLFLLKKILSPDIASIRSDKVFFLLLLAFFVFMALSLLNSGPLIRKSLIALFFKWGRFPLLLWVLLDTFCDSRRIVKAVWFLSASAALVGFSVFSEKLFHFEFLRWKVLESFPHAVMGPFKNQNGLAAYLTCVIPVVLSFALWKGRRVFDKTGLLLVTLMLMAASVWTSSRGGWVGLVAGLITLILFINCSRLSKKIFWMLLSASYVFCVPLTAAGLFFFQNRGDGQRFIIFHGAWKMITEHPFLGKGLGTFMDYCARYTNNYGTYYVHNCFLQMWAESGLFSLLSFLLLAGYALYRSLKVILKAPASLDRSILTGLTAGLLGFLVHSFFDVHLYSFQLSFLFWVVLGLTVAMTSCLERESAHGKYGCV